MIEVEMIAQAINGRRISVMPVVRMLKMVTRKLMAPKIDEKPMNWSAIAQIVCPVPVCRLSGG